MEIKKNRGVEQAMSLLALNNRITTALSSATGTAELAETIACILSSPLGFRFSRVFLLKYDPWRECFSSHLAMGISKPEEAEAITRRAAAEQEKLAAVSEELEREESGVSDLIGHLKVGSFWAEGIHRRVPELDLDGWANLQVFTEASDSLFARLAAGPGFYCLESAAELEMLPWVLRERLATPFIAFSIDSPAGVRMAVLGDRALQTDPTFSPEALSLLEMFRSQTVAAWQRAEMYADLEVSLGRLREMDSLKNNFLATISHELRTPLTAILGFLDLLVTDQVGPVSDQQRRLLDRSRRHADHLLGLVNDLIELAEFQAENARKLVTGPVVAHRAVRSAIARLAAGPRHDLVKVNIPDRSDEPCIVEANDAALERILYHLIDNAAKFSSPGDEIEVSFKLVEDNWHIAVADQGIGIDRAHLRKIFSHFYQVDSRLSRAYPGMGIGLTLVKILLEASGGHILVETELGRGSVFTVVYPRWRERA